MTVLLRVPAQPNAPLLEAPAQRALSLPEVNMPPPEQVTPITTGHLSPNNMQLSR